MGFHHEIRIVSIPQAVRIACNVDYGVDVQGRALFQYRKRYGLHAIMESILSAFGHGGVSIPQAVRIACNDKKMGAGAGVEPGFNTASGTDCMQCVEVPHRLKVAHGVSIPQAVRIACNKIPKSYDNMTVSIPQAVRIACNNRIDSLALAIDAVSIPQAVRIACNTVSRSPWKQ